MRALEIDPQQASAQFDSQVCEGLNSPASRLEVWSLLGRPIAFHRRLVDLTGSVKSALMLSQSLYWTRHGRYVAQNDGWFYKTSAQWTLETGLSLKEQSTARAALKATGILQERRTGVPARLYFRLNLNELRARLCEPGDASVRLGPELDASADLRSDNARDWALLAQLLGPTVAYHRVLSDIAGGIHGALMLSRALALTRAPHHRQPEAWIGRSATQWCADLGLSRREQETARRELLRTGVWEESLIGTVRTLRARLKIARLHALLTHEQANPQIAPHQGGEPGCGNATSRVSQKGESSMWDCHILVLPKPPRQFRRNRHPTDIPMTTRYLLQQAQPEQHAPKAAARVQTLCGGEPNVDELIFPLGMLDDEQKAARLHLRGCPDRAQTLLDELAGRLALKGVRTSAVAYLRALVAREQAGTFVPELAPGVADARAQRHRVSQLQQQRQAEELRRQAERETPEYQARVLLQRKKLSELQADMKRRLNARATC